MRKSQAGFTLLEVMIAITIMAVAFGAILTSQSGSIHNNIKSKELNVAAWLADNVMTEAEHLYEGKPFNEIPKEETKKFAAPFERYTWKRELKEIKFPEIVFPKAEGQSIPEPVRILIQTLTKYLNKTVREMVVTVSWPRGSGELKMNVTTYFVDLKVPFDFSI